MRTIRSIPIAQLLLDRENPRLHGEFGDQRSIIEGMLRDDSLRDKILALARDIAEYGINPADLVIVTPEGTEPDRYIVVEGNRRLAALRLLTKPAIAEEALPARLVTELRALANETKHLVTDVPAVVLPTRADADHWIEIRHGGEQEGAGIVRWDAFAGDRWRTRHKSAPSFVHQVLDLLTRLGVMPEWYTASPGRFPTTTLNRLLIGPDAKARFGLGLDDDGFLVLLNDPAKVAAAFRPVVDDLVSGAKTVTDLKRKEQREDYIRKRVTLPPASALPVPLRADAIARNPTKTSAKKGNPASHRKPAPSTRQQRALIPKSIDLNVTHPRINDIYHELMSIDVEDYPNTVGIAFRVFLELSVDHYINAQTPPIVSKTDQRDIKKGSLANKITAVANFMREKQIMTKHELTPVRELTRGNALFDSKVTLMNGYVHNKSVTPKPSELKSGFNDLTEFFRKLWS